MLMHSKAEYSPRRFSCRDISWVKILWDFVNWIRFFIIYNADWCSIMTFIDVFEEIFHCGNGCGDLNVDVTVVFCRKNRIIWYYMCIDEYMTMFMHFDAVILTSIHWIFINFGQGLCTESLRKSLTAFAILHTRCSRFRCSTWSMKHKGHDRLI